MNLELFDYYLVAVNFIGFFLYLLNIFLYSYTEKGQIDNVLTVWSIIGGAIGIMFAILLFDRKPLKKIMMSVKLSIIVYQFKR